MNIKLPENVSTEEYQSLRYFLDNDSRSTVPGIRTAIESVKEHFTTNTDYVQEVQDAFESVFSTLEYSLSDKVAFIRELVHEYNICISPRVYPYFSEVLKQFGPILRKARGYSE